MCWDRSLSGRRSSLGGVGELGSFDGPVPSFVLRYKVLQANSKRLEQPLIPKTDDTAWIEHAIRAIKMVEPRERGFEYVKARQAWAHDRVSREPADRIPGLIVALFDSYDARKAHAFSELMWLIEALYASLPSGIGTEEACAILAATRHSCGHGGVEAPIDIARSSFDGRPYTPAFFDALRTYRDRLKGLTSAEVTRARGEIALTLWQDPQEPLRPRHCLSRRVRDGFFDLPDDRRGLWTLLLRHVDRSARRRPDRKWVSAASTALECIGPKSFTSDLRRWLKVPEGPVPLSTGGRHVLKTLIWYAALAKTDNLDDVLPQLIDAQFAKPKAAVHLIYAVGYWLESRPPDVAEPLRSRLRGKWPTVGSRIRGSVQRPKKVR